MMDCSTEQIGRLIDRELTESEAGALEEHLATCAGCTAEVGRAALAKADVARAGRRFTPSAEFRESLRRQLTAGAGPGTPFPMQRQPPRPWLRVAALVVILAGLGLLLATWSRTRDDRQAAFAEIADLHAAVLASAHPVDVVSTDRHTVKPWFEGRLPFSFDLPDLPGPDLALLGGRLAWFHHTPAAHLLLRDRQHRLSLFILPLDSPFGRAVASSPPRTHGVGIEVWSRDGLRYVLIGDPDSGELCRIAHFFGGC